MREIALLLCLMLVGCVKVKGKVDPIEVKPIEVKHHITLDTDELYLYYQDLCRGDLPSNATQVEINACADDKLNDFIEKFTNVI